MKIFQSNLFAKKIKKLPKIQKILLDESIREIIANPKIGTEKKGDLQGIFIYKFKIKSTQYLVSYRFTTTELELIMFGQHENYYRDLKKYIK